MALSRRKRGGGINRRERMIKYGRNKRGEMNNLSNRRKRKKEKKNQWEKE